VCVCVCVCVCVYVHIFIFIGKVGGGATVEYEVELQDWNAVHDVAKDGGIIVKCLGQVRPIRRPYAHVRSRMPYAHVCSRKCLGQVRPLRIPYAHVM
jgi:hypothetical protein